MEWVKLFEVPGLILAAGVIFMLFRLLSRVMEQESERMNQRTEERALMTEMATMLRQLCRIDRNRGRGTEEGTER